ncbi:MAG: cytochrome c-type biogenesis protein CcmH [marine benthic group bacterium]|nr:cytochrome c-type biogenesis protein CcmH [Gemmatimonadota bacterium]MCL7968602.1 cytochrome c-type biogenesis protein CcmH [Gemmatimonadota bacterium]MCL7977198.1 cytochrome c-type biogenesis protein CcmH [Gemmatimonadota bacterium]
MKRRLSSIAVLAAFLGAAPLVAQDAVPAQPEAPPQSDPALMDRAEEELDAKAAEIAAELRCPVCRNQAVVESNAELSREMQALVRERLVAGDSPDEVKEYFVSRYGEWILLEPQRRGINWVVWILPFLALAAGAVLAVILVRKWAAAGSGDEAAVEPAAVLSDENERWIREAIRNG